ncbi:MAG: bifunctional [glutamine synthetase] adenylyltransferase/[glutamine synthetase]-adenylyl-L-tyrosine phosphorylase [Pseudomonadota bacterium]
MFFDVQTERPPLAYETERADDTLAKLPWAKGQVAELLHGTAGCSPYLAALMEREAAWLEAAMGRNPADVFDEVLAGLEPGDVAETGRALREAKRRVALLVALADLGGVWSLGEVTAALTRLADTALDVALKTTLGPELARGRLPGKSIDDLDKLGGLFVLAMGKMGAYELNYSSDIDLICMFDDAPFEDGDLYEARAIFAKAVRKATSLMSEITGDGYVFRTDLRLRPDPSVTPVVISISAAIRYYEALGRTWERKAYIKARPAVGDLKAGRRFLREIRPFIWRRHLDFATIEDAHEIRQKIRVAKHADCDHGLDGRDVKLCPGGIREIEFFAQTKQLIAGGRDPELRIRGTCEGLMRLSEKGWVRHGTAASLNAAYIRLREIEHRLQMIRDAQTQSLPATPDGWARLAYFFGGTDVAALRDEIEALFEGVHHLTESFFAPTPPEALTEGLEFSDSIQRLISGWSTYPALRSPRARAILNRLKPGLLSRLAEAARPDEAVAQFDGFLKGLPAGVQILSLFEANPYLVDLMVDVSSNAPALARYLSGHPEVLDAVIGGAFFAPWPGEAALEAELRTRLAEEGLDYEGQLDAARRWKKDWRFRVGVHHLRGLVDPSEAAVQYSDLARATVAALWDAVCAEFSRKHGQVPGRGAVVVGLGSLGAEQLTATSDLDLIVIYDAPEGAESDGKRSLPARTYYARLTKALITALSVRTAAGKLYEVDMRLRPSGRQGPAEASWSAYQAYQLNEAWTWEHLALTRARVVAGNADLGGDFEAFRKKVLRAPCDTGEVLRDLADMRGRLAEAKAPASVWDVALGPGGSQDIELFAQAVALLSGAPRRKVADQLAGESKIVDHGDAQVLEQTHRFMTAIKATSRLLSEGAFEPEALGHGGRMVLMRVSGAETVEALAEEIAAATSHAGEIIDAAIARHAAPADTSEDVPADKAV